MCEGVMVVIKYNYCFLQLTIAKSPVCDSEEFVVTIEEKGLLLDWVATGTENHHAHAVSFSKTKRCHGCFSLTFTAELNNRQLPTRGDPTSISLAVRSCTEGI